MHAKYKGKFFWCLQCVATFWNVMKGKSIELKWNEKNVETEKRRDR